MKLPGFRGERPQTGEIELYAETAAVQADMHQLGQVSVEADERKSWVSMMHAIHPQGRPRLPGKVLKYWIVSEYYGRLGGLSFHAASWHERARDKYIVWRVRILNRTGELSWNF